VDLAGNKGFGNIAFCASGSTSKLASLAQASASASGGINQRELSARSFRYVCNMMYHQQHWKHDSLAPETVYPLFPSIPRAAYDRTIQVRIRIEPPQL
jgi:hypothetical protein